ncbi:MAG TPA: hypothetical protein VMX17_07860 [Candidatus Glassbacteria bacterium]|nr:hypothetical protein [Candidatus Glassbacteria bacterium]
MGIDYTFILRVGYQIKEEDLIKAFMKQTITPERFHYEDRFDIKTGEKTKPQKVIDEKKQVDCTWIIGSERFKEDSYEDVMAALVNTFNCNVDYTGDFCSGNFVYEFYLHEDNGKSEDYGKVTLYNMEMLLQKVVNMHGPLLGLKLKMENLGLMVGPPKVFISSRIG